MQERIQIHHCHTRLAITHFFTSCLFGKWMYNGVVNFSFFIHRFVAIIYPLQARSFCTMKHAKFVTIFIWIGSFVIASPTAFVRVSAFCSGIKASQ